MDFYEWAETPEANEYRRRIKAGEKGNKDNPRLAAYEAYSAGIREGKHRAAEKLANFIER